MWSNPAGCSLQCAQMVKSEQEARGAVAAFFSSEISRQFIANLRQDGLTDEYLVKLKVGCDGCYVFRGERERNYDPSKWYAVAGIAPSTMKKDVVLLIECANSVRLDHTLYGG